MTDPSASGPPSGLGLGANARAWLLLAVGATFGAGVLVGLLIPAAREALAAPDQQDPDELYVRGMADQYGLSARQVRLLRMVLRARDAEHREILMRDVERLPLALRHEIQDVHRRAEERIKSLLTPEQLTRFSQDSRPASDFAPGRAEPGPNPDDVVPGSEGARKDNE